VAPDQPRSAVPALEFVLATEPQLCARCGGEALLAGKAAYEQPGPHGEMVRCLRDVLLCARCDQGDPAASALIVFFAVHGEVTEETAQGFIALVSAWAAHARTRDVDLAALERDIETWHRGELDADEPPPSGPYKLDDDRLEWPDDALNVD
jgi:Family of unknown function (DUF6300)